MPDNQERKPTAEVHQSVNVTTIKRRVLTRKNQNDKNYPVLQRGREIIERNYNSIKTIIKRNYRRLVY